MRKKLDTKAPVAALEATTVLPPLQAPVPDFPKFLTREWFLALCCGNEDAATVAETFTRDCHLTDDIVDGDKKFTDEDLIFARLIYLENLTLSPFWQKHGPTLMPIFKVTASAFLDANRWAHHEDPRYRVASDILKSQYADVIYYFALITGGWGHMRKMQSHFRVIDFDRPEWGQFQQTRP